MIIGTNLVNAVIYTGANSSVISFDFVKRLKISILITEKTNITLANEASYPSSETCIDIPIIVANKNFPCSAIVLGGSAQDLLIGTTWLQKYNGNISFSKNLLTIDENTSQTIKLSCNISKIIELSYIE